MNHIERKTDFALCRVSLCRVLCLLLHSNQGCPDIFLDFDENIYGALCLINLQHKLDFTANANVLQIKVGLVTWPIRDVLHPLITSNIQTD